MRFIFPALAVATLALSTQAFAWGGRGHHAICSAAVHLVKNETLKTFLKHRPHTMGHLCNIPDIFWKSISADARKLGDPTHYIDPEVLGVPVKDLPIDYAKIAAAYTGKPNKFKEGMTIMNVPSDFGSLWWRADQFMRRITALKEPLASTIPEGSKAEQDDKNVFNQAVYDFMVNAGLLGHFVGDASQPFHASADYDGWETGHGGIHGYYEEAIVAEAGPDLEAQIAAAGAKIRKAPFLEKGTVLERMKALSEESRKEIPKVLKLDPILKKSERKKEKGMELKTAADRSRASVGWKKMGEMVITEMGRSARLLAEFWDEAYVDAGSPRLEAYRSYRYPFTPDFVAPDYLPAPAPSADKAAK